MAVINTWRRVSTYSGQLSPPATVLVEKTLSLSVAAV